MSYCINPHCPKPADPGNATNRICRNCGSDILLRVRYRVIKKLGSGGFGQTFEVDDSGTAKVVKVLTENNSKAIELFQQEAKVLGQLNSMGIPKVDSDAYFTVLPKNSSVPLHCLVYDSANSPTSILDCIASQDSSSKECTDTRTYISEGIKIKYLSWLDKFYLVYVCPSCVIAHDEISGSREQILTAFIKWFLTLEKPKRRELISLLGDDKQAIQLRSQIREESNQALQEYWEARKRVEQQERERRRQELLGQ
jgi:DNA-directed RNA polymerase subunit RPC12/RpoP